MSCTLGLICVDIHLLDPADTFTLPVTVLMYIKHRLVKLYGPVITSRHLQQANNLKLQQQKFLLDLINYNKDTVYGRRHYFRQVKSIEDFGDRVPLGKYDLFKPYVDRIGEGEKNVLTRCDIYGLGRTSGTTGTPKLIPLTHYNKKLGLTKYFFMYMYDPIRKGAVMKLKRTITVGHRPRIDVTRCGIECAPVAYFYKFRDVSATSPSCVFDIGHEMSALYLHAVFACREKEVNSMVFNFADQANKFFEFMQENSQAICNDIEKGSLTLDGLEISEEISQNLEKHLVPDAQRAMQVRNEFSKGSLGLGRRLWCDLEFCRVITTGSSMSHYTRTLEQKYLKDIILVPHGFGGTEGFYGHNVSHVQNDCRFFLTYPFAFFEFIREVDIESDQPNTVLAHQVSHFATKYCLNCFLTL